MPTNISSLLSSLSNEDCLRIFEEYLKDPNGFQQRTRDLIDANASPFKNLLWALSQHLGQEAAVGATTVLGVLLRKEEEILQSN